jgi:hypothetical protein
MIGFGLYSVTLLFGIFEQIAFFIYFLTCIVSLVIVYFFGSVDYYQKFETSGRHYKVGFVEAQTKFSANRVFIYYPTPK